MALIYPRKYHKFLFFSGVASLVDPHKPSQDKSHATSENNAAINSQATTSIKEGAANSKSDTFVQKASTTINVSEKLGDEKIQGMSVFKAIDFKCFYGSDLLQKML